MKLTTHSPFTIVLYFTWETRSLHFMMQFLTNGPVPIKQAVNRKSIEVK